MNQIFSWIFSLKSALFNELNINLIIHVSSFLEFELFRVGGECCVYWYRWKFWGIWPQRMQSFYHSSKLFIHDCERILFSKIPCMKKKNLKLKKVLMHYAICALKMYYVLAIRECEMLHNRGIFLCKYLVPFSLNVFFIKPLWKARTYEPLCTNR